MDIRKLQTFENINLTKDLVNLKTSLFREAKKDSLSSLVPKVSNDKLKLLENEMESLKLQIKELKITQESTLTVEAQKENLLPVGFEKILKMMTQFNEILENRIMQEGENKILKEFEKGDQEMKDIGLSLKEMMVDQKKLSNSSNELSILMGIEMFLGENKIEESLKLVRWRKKILKLMEVCGWEVANEISHKTMKKLEVDIEDIIQANLEVAIKDENNFLSNFIEK